MKDSLGSNKTNSSIGEKIPQLILGWKLSRYFRIDHLANDG